jgi:zinc D-Ala-D-Ala carboxypeptidase
MRAGKWIIAFAVAAALGGIIIQAEGERQKTKFPESILKPIASKSNAVPPPSETQPIASESNAVPPLLETQPESGKPQQKPEKPTPRPDNPDTNLSLPAWAAANLPDHTIHNNDDGLAVITNPSSLYVLVNKTRNLPSSYVPQDLVVPDVPFSFSGDSPKKQLRKDAAAALEKLFAGAEKAGFELKAVSGYRAYATQKTIFIRNAAQKGEEAANRTSAHPGQSEHQIDKDAAADISDSKLTLEQFLIQ